MIAGQTLRKGNYQVLLFPLPYMNISQDEGGSFSHAGTLNIDFLGWDEYGRVLQCSYYAPCDLKLVYQSIDGAYNIWESTHPVYTADNLLQYITIMCIHDDNVTRYHVNDVVHQGELLGKTGTSGYVTGDHVHLNVARGKYVGQIQVPPDNQWELRNSEHIYDLMYVNDTVIINGEGHNWKTYDAPIVYGMKHKFKWVLYSRKLRNKRS